MEQNTSQINPFEPQVNKTQAQNTGSNPVHGDIHSNPVSAQGNNTQASPENQEPKQYKTPSVRSWILFLLTGFLLMLVYIYNSGHANKALRTKEKLTKELKELHSESISIESQITNASTQSALTKRLEGSGLKEITTPPIKLMRKKKDE